MKKIYLERGDIAVFTSTKGEEIEVSLETVTPEQAQIYQGRVKVNRKIKAKTVDAYARDMKDGNWRINGEPLIFFKGGAQANGEHRELACIKAETPFETLIVRGIDPEAMKTIDSGVKRNSGDKLKIEYEDQIYDSITTAAVIKNILDMRNGGTMITARGRNFTDSEISKEFGDNIDNYNKIVRNASSIYSGWKHMSKVEMATMMMYLIYDLHHPEEKVNDFFDQLGDKKPACTTIRTLRRRLAAFQNKRGTDDVGGENKIDADKKPGVLRRIYITMAWNAFASGNMELTSISYVYDRDKDRKFI